MLTSSSSALLAFVLLALGTASSEPSRGQGMSVPATLDVHGDGQLEWIAASYALSADAEDPAAIELRAYLRMLDTLPEGHCDRRVFGSDRTSLADLAQMVEDMGVGTVQAVEPGLGWGLPGSLVAVRVDRLIRAQSALVESDLIFLFTPKVDAEIGGQRFCATGGDSIPLPGVGGSVVFTTHGGALAGISGLGEGLRAALEIDTRSVIPIATRLRGIQVEGGERLTRMPFTDQQALIEWLVERARR
ncbi:MAG: hypothetical protein AAGK22_20445 [Acidobacteriota bacterium]